MGGVSAIGASRVALSEEIPFEEGGDLPDEQAPAFSKERVSYFGLKRYAEDPVFFAYTLWAPRLAQSSSFQEIDQNIQDRIAFVQNNGDEEHLRVLLKKDYEVLGLDLREAWYQFQVFGEDVKHHKIQDKVWARTFSVLRQFLYNVYTSFISLADKAIDSKYTLSYFEHYAGFNISYLRSQLGHFRTLLHRNNQDKDISYGHAAHLDGGLLIEANASQVAVDEVTTTHPELKNLLDRLQTAAQAFVEFFVHDEHHTFPTDLQDEIRDFGHDITGVKTIFFGNAQLLKNGIFKGDAFDREMADMPQKIAQLERTQQKIHRKITRVLHPHIPDSVDEPTEEASGFTFNAMRPFHGSPMLASLQNFTFSR